MATIKLRLAAKIYCRRIYWVGMLMPTSRRLIIWN